MKKMLSFFLIFVMGLLQMCPVLAAPDFVTINASTSAMVVEVIEGDALMVKLPNGSLALVKMAGIETKGYDAAFLFTNNELMGNPIYIIPEYNQLHTADRFNKVYIYKNNVLFNSLLLQNGLAKVNKEDANASLYTTLVQNERTAKSKKIGVWNEGFISGEYIYSGSRININTATAEQLKSILGTSTTALAEAIVSYRTKRPFQTVNDIKFVKGMTKSIFDDSRDKMSVITNLNEASETELRSLRNMTDTKASEIVEHQTRFGFKEPYDLVDKGFMTTTNYTYNRYFMDTQPADHITYAVPNVVANINTATRSQLVLAGLTSEQADHLIVARNKYPIKTLYELSNISGLRFTELQINQFSDNLYTYTDINTATSYELKSLIETSSSTTTTSSQIQNIERSRPFINTQELERILSKETYSKILPYLYVDDWNVELININTASLLELKRAGFKEEQARTIYAKQGSMKQPSDIPFDLGTMKHKATLYTNINRATVAELQSLGDSMNIALINAIISYREDQPFGSQEEIKNFFVDQKAESAYNQFRNFVVVQ